MSNKQIWAPWRMDYLDRPLDVKTRPSCVFCEILKLDKDRDNLILHRSDKAFIVLNKYPYNNGHLMVVPTTHESDYLSLSDADHKSLADLSKKSVAALTLAYKPQGFNIGMNVGGAAGAGIKEHLHLHIVPRWNGDTNFMPVIGDVKVMPEHLMACFDKVKDVFERM